jgi:hypothetical protein
MFTKLSNLGFPVNVLNSILEIFFTSKDSLFLIDFDKNWLFELPFEEVQVKKAAI